MAYKTKYSNKIAEIQICISKVMLLSKDEKSKVNRR
jgi:hypothetical protein